MVVLHILPYHNCKGNKMAEAKKTTKPKRAVATARKATDARIIGSAANPTKVAGPAPYKTIKPAQVVKGKAGRPKKAK